jgi:hypothetical protein
MRDITWLRQCPVTVRKVDDKISARKVKTHQLKKGSVFSRGAGVASAPGQTGTIWHNYMRAN